ncbi:MAG: MBL fold metallo-hydrolase [bacterium]|nr:MBL fold metallo-hydrolase [bacterium]
MQINWLGHSCFLINVQTEKNGPIKILIDPFDEKTGLKMPKVEADILLISHDHFDHNNKSAVKGDYFLIDSPGEFEVKGIYIEGISAFHDEQEGKERGAVTIYKIEAEDLKICHLSDFCQRTLNSYQEEKIGEPDVLMVPVGGNFTLGPAEAWKVVQEINPKIIIPMHYKTPELKIDLKGVKEFLKEAGQEDIVSEKKLTIKKKDLEAKEMEIVVLESK